MAFLQVRSGISSLCKVARCQFGVFLIPNRSPEILQTEASRFCVAYKLTLLGFLLNFPKKMAVR